jgi:hypothetical protein
MVLMGVLLIWDGVMPNRRGGFGKNELCRRLLLLL